jgi:hypothetical protein
MCWPAPTWTCGSLDIGAANGLASVVRGRLIQLGDVARAVGVGPIIEIEDLAETLKLAVSRASDNPPRRPLAEAEREHIIEMPPAVDGNESARRACRDSTARRCTAGWWFDPVSPARYHWGSAFKDLSSVGQ